MSFGDWGGFLNQLLKKLPIQGRKERIKNRLDDLDKKRTKLITKGTWNVKKAEALNRIDSDISRQQQLLKNLA